MESVNPASGQATPEGMQCDFCGAEVPRVSRIALDGEYERLRTPHKVQYACASCSQRKEAARRSQARS